MVRTMIAGAVLIAGQALAVQSGDEPDVTLTYNAKEPSAKLKITKKDKDVSAAKDAANVTHGNSVQVKIENPNTFVHVYSAVGVSSADYPHAVPAPLASLVLLTTPQTSAPTTFVPFPSSWNGFLPEHSDDKSKTVVNKFLRELRDVQRELQKVPFPAEAQKVDENLEGVLYHVNSDGIPWANKELPDELDKKATGLKGELAKQISASLSRSEDINAEKTEEASYRDELSKVTERLKQLPGKIEDLKKEKAQDESEAASLRMRIEILNGELADQLHRRERAEAQIGRIEEEKQYRQVLLNTKPKQDNTVNQQNAVEELVAMLEGAVNLRSGRLQKELDELETSYQDAGLTAAQISAALASQLNKMRDEAVAAASDRLSKYEAIRAKVRRCIAIRNAAKAAPEELTLGTKTVSGDEYKVVVSVAPTETFTKRSNVPGAVAPPTITSSATLKVYGRQVMDFSLGIGTTNLETQKWSVMERTEDDPDSDDPSATIQVNRIVRGQRDKGDIQLIALAHFYKTTANRYTSCPSFGVSIKDGQFRGLAGYSLVITGPTRTYVTAGWAFGKSERLSGYQEGDKVPAATKPDVSSVTRSGLFLGVTASFTTRL